MFEKIKKALKIKTKEKPDLLECVKCNFIRLAVKYKIGSKKRISKAACLKTGINIADRHKICIWFQNKPKK
jgi:hypothetical protein